MAVKRVVSPLKSVLVADANAQRLRCGQGLGFDEKSQSTSEISDVEFLVMDSVGERGEPTDVREREKRTGLAQPLPVQSSLPRTVDRL